MKKFRVTVSLIVVFCLFISLFLPNSLASNNNTWEKLDDSIVLYVGTPNALVENTDVLVDPANKSVVPYIKNSRTLVPVRFITEALGAEVLWEGDTKTVTVLLNNQAIRMVINSKTINIDGRDVEIDIAPEIKNARTFLPLRALSESLGKEVFYDRKLIIISNTQNIFDINSEKDKIDEVISRVTDPIKYIAMQNAKIIHTSTPIPTLNPSPTFTPMPTLRPMTTSTPMPTCAPSLEYADSYKPEPYPITTPNTEEYSGIYENKFMDTTNDSLSTFSIDVDTTSYSHVRRYLNGNFLPPEDAVRIEEMINYFDYDYPLPDNGDPFSVSIEVADCPWESTHDLMKIGLKGRDIAQENLPPSNLVFLLDVSGSMWDNNKLPLLKEALKLLVKELDEQDTISIVVYAGSAGTILEPTSGNQKDKIINAIQNLQADGFTAGGQGIQHAYNLAQQNFIEGGNNRVILATDGDFNVGVSSDSALETLIEEKRELGVFLSVLGIGAGNIKDSKMQILADKGNGNYSYIDNIKEAQKVLVNDLRATLFAIAKDVKIQIEFNPSHIQQYRLIGYENRILDKQDFNDDTKDAGEIGSGHTVTAFYEIVPVGSEEVTLNVDDLKYQESTIIDSDEIATVKLRYKEIDEETSKLITHIVTEDMIVENPSLDFKFASSVAEFGMLLRDSEFKGSSSLYNVYQRAMSSIGEDPFGYRGEFLELVKKSGDLMGVVDLYSACAEDYTDIDVDIIVAPPFIPIKIRKDQKVLVFYRISPWFENDVRWFEKDACWSSSIPAGTLDFNLDDGFSTKKPFDELTIINPYYSREIIKYSDFLSEGENLFAIETTVIYLTPIDSGICVITTRRPSPPQVPYYLCYEDSYIVIVE